jgi:hypothetical protein
MSAEHSREVRDLALAIRRQKRVVILFVFAILLPAAILGFFGLRALESDRFRIEELLKREREEALRDTAARIRAGLTQLFEDLNHLASSEEGWDELPGTVLRVSLSGDFQFLRERYRIRGRERDPRLSEESRELLEAEKLEFASRSLEQAAARYQRLSRSPDPYVRSSAVVGLARVSGREKSLRTYRRLLLEVPDELERDTAAHALMASLGVAAIYRERGEASKGITDLLAGYELLTKHRWVVSSELFRYYSSELEREMEELCAAKKRSSFAFPKASINLIGDDGKQVGIQQVNQAWVNDFQDGRDVDFDGDGTSDGNFAFEGVPARIAWNFAASGGGNTEWRLHWTIESLRAIVSTRIVGFGIITCAAGEATSSPCDGSSQAQAIST